MIIVYLLIGFIFGSLVTFWYMNKVIVPEVIKKLEKEGNIKINK